MNPDCDAVVILHDDHWGAIRQRCERPFGHPGQHSVALGASEPPAYIRWTDTGSGPRRDGAPGWVEALT